MLLLSTNLITSCKGKPKDADITAAIQQKITTPGVSVSVKDGVATLTGEVKSESDKASAETEDHLCDATASNMPGPFAGQAGGGGSITGGLHVAIEIRTGG